MTHCAEPKFKPVTGKQCRSKVATDAGDGKNKVCRQFEEKVNDV